MRKYLINSNFIYTIIQLLKDLFFCTSIFLYIIILKK
ncbi:MAG: SAM-dependent methyltransferase [Endomicrobium sp.]|nr:SAM-dependent methyltransferase [Endomicrobium sp.]